jgi:hypothetical protein
LGWILEQYRTLWEGFWNNTEYIGLDFGTIQNTMGRILEQCRTHWAGWAGFWNNRKHIVIDSETIQNTLGWMGWILEQQKHIVIDSETIQNTLRWFPEQWRTLYSATLKDTRIFLIFLLIEFNLFCTSMGATSVGFGGGGDVSTWATTFTAGSRDKMLIQYTFI